MYSRHRAKREQDLHCYLQQTTPNGRAREDTSTGATRLTLELAELPLYVAVTVAL